MLRVTTPSGTAIVHFPLRFLQSSSKSTWADILAVTKDRVNKMSPVSKHPVAGDYLFSVGKSLMERMACLGPA